MIDRLDISGIESTYKGGGTSSFHPRMLLKVIVYSYMCNVYPVAGWSVCCMKT